jgi:hypothetical protein
MEDSFLEAAIREARQGMREGGIPIASVYRPWRQDHRSLHNCRIQRGEPSPIVAASLWAPVRCMIWVCEITRFRNFQNADTLHTTGWTEENQ